MDKKVLFLSVLLFVFTGCSHESSSVDDVVLSSNYDSVANCYLDGDKFTMYFKSGKIVKYTDPIDGDLSQESIDVINGEHLVGVVSDDKAISIMDKVIKDLGGYCEKEE